MPYPMLPALSFRRFRERLINDFSCEAKQLGNPVEGTYVERVVDDKVLQSAIDWGDDNDRVQWSLVRRLCDQLEIDPAEFDLDLG